MVYLINSYTIFTLYYQDIEDLQFGTFLEGIAKEDIIFLCRYLKEDPVLFSNKYIIHICSNNGFIGFLVQVKTEWPEELLIIHTVMEIDLSKSYQFVPPGFIRWVDLIS